MGSGTAIPWNVARPVARVAFANVKFRFPLAGRIAVDTNA